MITLVDAHPELVRVIDVDRQNQVLLHRALELQAPLSVIQYLVRAWPNGLLAQDVNRCQPIHIACQHQAPLSVIRYMVCYWCEWVPTFGTAMPEEGGDLIAQLTPQDALATFGGDFLPLHWAKRH